MENIEFLLVRTTSTIGSVAGSFDITLSTDEYDLDYEIDPGEGITPEVTVHGDTEWPWMTTGTYFPIDMGWYFGEYSGEDPDRRVLTSMLLAGEIDENGDELVVGVTKLSEEDNRYKIIALSGTVPTDNVFTYGDDPFSEVLGVWYTDTLAGEYSFTKSRDSDEYLYIIIQNWSTSKLDLDEEPELQFFCDNFDRWLGPEGGQPQLAILGNPSEISEFGAGVSVILTPFDPDPNTDPNNSNQYQISELDGTFSVYITETQPNVPEEFQPDEVEMLFTWSEGSSGGCSALGFIPGSLLILLPLFLLFKKR